MQKATAPCRMTWKKLLSYQRYLCEQEKNVATIQPYMHTLTAALEHFGEAIITKAALLTWKEQLSKRYATASINKILATLNGFFAYIGWNHLKMKLLKWQKPMFSDSSKELTRAEYERLIRAAQAKGNKRLALVIQTICATGIRVSELKFITVKAVQEKRVTILNKGKQRVIILTNHLCQVLKKYLKEQKRTQGSVFVTKNGKPLDRSNIWREMKQLCADAAVEPAKVFPHNLRHFFARTYYAQEKDLSRLADILGHTNVNTTRIYTRESGMIHAQQMEKLGLIIT